MKNKGDNMSNKEKQIVNDEKLEKVTGGKKRSGNPVLQCRACGFRARRMGTKVKYNVAYQCPNPQCGKFEYYRVD